MFSGSIMWLLDKFKLYIAVAGAFAIALIAAWFRGHSAGSAANEARHAARARRDAETVNRSRADTKSKSDEDLNKEVEKWTQD